MVTPSPFPKGREDLYPGHQNDYMQLFLFSGIDCLKVTVTITLFNP